MRLSLFGARQRSTGQGKQRMLPPRSARLRTGAVVGALAMAGSLLSAGVVLAPAEPAAAATIPTITCTTDPAIFNTGFNSASGGQTGNGSPDERWEAAGGVAGLNHSDVDYTGPSGATYPTGASWAPAYAGKINNAWADSQSGRSQWISANYVPPSNGQNQTNGGGNWYYRYQFNLAAQVDPASFRLDMSWLADNSVAAVWVNDVAQSGANLPQSPADPYNAPGFIRGQEAVTQMASNWRTGLNTILVQVKSNYPAEGFNAEVRSRALCPTMQVQKTVDGRVDAADQFTVTAADAAGNAVTSTTTTGTDTTATSTRVPVTFGSTYTITDAMAEGSPNALSRYDGVLVCRDTTTGQPVATSGTGPSWTVNIATHDAYLCNVTNAMKQYTVTKTASKDVLYPGESIDFTVTVRNTGQGAYREDAPATITDDLSEVLDDATYVDGSASDGATVDGNTLSWSGPLAVGESKTITYSAVVNAPATGDRLLHNKVDADEGNGGVCDVCETETPVRTFAVQKTSEAEDGIAHAGAKVSYTVSVTNTGKADYTEEAPAAFTDDLSKVTDDATYNDDVTGGATVDGNTLSWSGPLKVGETKKITYSFTVHKSKTGNGVLENSVNWPPNIGGDCLPDEDACKTTDLVGSFTVEKTSDKTTTGPGGVVQYEVTVKNTGEADYTAEHPATFTDDLSKVTDDATYNRDASRGATVKGDTLYWKGALAKGKSVTVAYSFTVNDPDTGDRKLTNVVDPGIGGSCAADGTCITNTAVKVPPAPPTPAGLAFTGTDLVGPGIGFALLLLTLGGGILVLRRRSQHGSEHGTIEDLL